jgi:integrase
MSDSSRITLRTALTAYLASSRFRSNAATVQAEYQRVADHLNREVGRITYGQISRAWVRSLRDTWAANGHRAATIRLQVLKNALEPAMSDGELDAKLFDGLQRVNRPHGLPEQNVAWTNREVEVVIQYCEGKQLGLARAVALARFAGLRRQTICSLLESNRLVGGTDAGLQQRWIVYNSEKGEVAVEIPEDRRLTEVLDRTFTMVDGPVAYSMRYTAWAPRQLNQALDRVVGRLADAKLVRPNLTLHGLRHSRGVELAVAGASDAVLMSQLGHTDEQSARVYRRQAARAAMALYGQQLVDSMTQREVRS